MRRKTSTVAREHQPDINRRIFEGTLWEWMGDLDKVADALERVALAGTVSGREKYALKEAIRCIDSASHLIHAVTEETTHDLTMKDFPIGGPSR